MKVVYPTQEEIDDAISCVIKEACPDRENVFIFLYRLYREIGFFDVMHGMEKIMVLLIAAYVLGILCLAGDVMASAADLYLSVILFSPLVFQLLLCLFLLGEAEQGVYEIELSCKYTMYHLLILRMGIAGLFSAAVNGMALVFYGILQNFGGELILRLAFLAVSTFLVYFTVYVQLILKSVRIQHQISLYFAWCAAAVLIRLCMPGVFAYLAMELPLFIHVCIWGAMLGLIMRLLPDVIYKNGKYNLNIGE